MTEIFLTYQRFIDPDEATAFADFLKEHGITCVLEDHSLAFDATFAYNERDKEFRIKLRKEDFAVADKIQFDILSPQLDSVDKDYHLFSFTDQELFEIVAKSDEWSKFDFLLAQKILKERGKEINPELVDIIAAHRIKDLTRPEDNSMAWIAAGYLFAVMGGLLGLFIGLHLMSHKRTLPTGDRIYAYSQNDRKQGYRIVIIGSVLLLVWAIVKSISMT